MDRILQEESFFVELKHLESVETFAPVRWQTDLLSILVIRKFYSLRLLGTLVYLKPDAFCLQIPQCRLHETTKQIFY